MYKVQNYRVTVAAFPACNYAQRRATLLHERFVELALELGDHTTNDMIGLDTIDVNIIGMKDAQTPLTINDVKSKTSSVELSEEHCFKDIESFLVYLETRGSTFSIDLFVDGICDKSQAYDISERLKKFEHEMVIVQEDDSSVSRDKAPSPRHGCYTATRERIKDDVDDILERIVLKAITSDCKHLKSLVDGFQNCDTTESEELHPYCTETDGQKKLVEAKYPEDISEEKRRCTDKDRIESLMAEMLALFRTSNVPEDEKPNFSIDHKSRIDEKLEADLSRISPPIKGYGYRFGIFVIHIEEPKNPHVRESIMKKIRSVMEGRCVNPYQVEEISKELEHYSRDVEVGAEIVTGEYGNRISGTLGCFAYMHEMDHGKTRCALISKHLTKNGNRFLCSDFVVGDLISMTTKTDNKTDADIAAIKLKEDVRVFGQFKPEEFYPGMGYLHCKLYDFVEDRMTGILYGGQLVYIWGAVSKPGKGVVKFPDYRSKKWKDGLILIEDRNVKKGDIPERFCKDGDSGAIVCVEDRRGKFVHAIAMIMGVVNADAMRSNPTTRGMYVTVPLSRRLQELFERTGCKFELQETIDK